MLLKETPTYIFFQIFTDDVNRAIDLVLQDNGRSLEEKRKDINAIKFQLVGYGVSNLGILNQYNLPNNRV